jgi:hypothetical protein
MRLRASPRPDANGAAPGEWAEIVLVVNIGHYVGR